MINAEKIDEITSRIANNFNPDKIILFGSYASGNQNDDSDLDLLIIQDSDLPKHKRGLDVNVIKGFMIPMDINILIQNLNLKKILNIHF